ncbi:MAG: hypothetical protein KTR31_20560 [Myxococcales bacterium]|nr:hypothetical protein [Myxococcales bacterium]
MNWRAAAVGAVTLATGLSLFVFVTGPVRGLFGDVLIIVLGVSVMAAVGLWTAWVRVLGMVALGTVAEGFQALDLVGPDSHWLLHLTVGSTPDPLDLVAYGVGGVVAWGLERWWMAAGAEKTGLS